MYVNLDHEPHDEGEYIEWDTLTYDEWSSRGEKWQQRERYINAKFRPIRTGEALDS